MFLCFCIDQIILQINQKYELLKKMCQMVMGSTISIFKVEG